jgi:hypothetical protein
MHIGIRRPELLYLYRVRDTTLAAMVAGRLLRGRPSRAPARGLLAHLEARREPGRSSLVTVRHRRPGGPPVPLQAEIQAIVDGCATWDGMACEWAGNLRDRLIFAFGGRDRYEAGRVLGMAIGDFVMGRGGTDYVEVGTSGI